MKDHWTAEEYRRFIETGKEPRSERQRQAEEAWAKAEREGRIMELDIPPDHPEQDEKPKKLDVIRYVNCPLDPEISKIPGKVDLRSIAAYVMPKKPRKYRNEPTWVDGIRFDSKHEAEVYRDLMLLVKAGELKCVCRQTKFDLGGGPHAQRDSRYQYVADFLTIDNDGKVAVYDAKSPITRKNRTYIDKKKAMLALWDIEIIEV